MKAAVTPEKAVEETVTAIQKPEPKVSSDRPEPEKTAAIAAPQPAEGPTSKAPMSKAPTSEVKPEVALPPAATLEIAACACR